MTVNSWLQALDSSYLPDWVTTLVVIVFALPFEELIAPRKRLFRLDNPAIQFPMTAHEHVPNWLLVILVFLLPGATIATFSVSSARLRKTLEVSSLAFLFAMSFNMLITNGLKFLIGNPRPDFLSRCQPKAGTPLDKYVDVSVCTTKVHSIMFEAFKSSPSGHSSSAFCGLGFVALWLNGEVKLFGQLTRAWQAVAFLSPFMLALFIAVSRIIDYRHHWYDVLCGSVLGLSVAYGTYSLYFKNRDGRADGARELRDPPLSGSYA